MMLNSESERVPESFGKFAFSLKKWSLRLRFQSRFKVSGHIDWTNGNGEKWVVTIWILPHGT